MNVLPEPVQYRWPHQHEGHAKPRDQLLSIQQLSAGLNHDMRVLF